MNNHFHRVDIYKSIIVSYESALNSTCHSIFGRARNRGNSTSTRCVPEV